MMKQYTYVLHYKHRHGENVTTWASLEDAREARAEIIMNNIEDEVSDADVRRAIADAYENDDFMLCHRLYTTEVEDESLEIQESPLRGNETKRPFIVADANTDLAHRVQVWPFAEQAGVLLCGMLFLWQCPQTTTVTCFMYLPKDPPILSCLQCIAAEHE